MSNQAKSHHLANELPSNIEDMQIGQHFLDPDLANSPHPEISSLAQVHNGFRTTLTNLVQSRQVIDPEQTLDKSFMDAHRLAEQRKAQLLSMSERAAKQAHDTLGALDNDITNALALRDPPSGSEIRSHFKTLPPEERLSSLIARADAGDFETLAAVLTQKGYLSGVTDEQLEVLRKHHSERNAPEQVKRKAVIMKAIKHVIHAHIQFVQNTQQLFPQERIDAINAKKKAASSIREAISTGGF